MNAWIDCMSSLDEAEGITDFRLQPEELVVIEISGFATLLRNAPEQARELVECTAYVNGRYQSWGSQPKIAIAPVEPEAV